MATVVRGRLPGGAAGDHRDHSDNNGPQQPFDQRVRGRSVEEKLEAMRVAQKKYEEALEDGELPSLQTSTTKKKKIKGLGGMMGGRLVNGHRTTTRPLSPPSQAGLVGVEEVVRNEAVRARLPPAEVSKQRQFWSQFEREEGDDGDDGDDDVDDLEIAASGRQRGAVAVDAEYDDIPDDERLDRKITTIQRKVGAKNKRDDAASASEDYSSAAEPSTVESSVDYGFADPDGTSNLCAQTLTVLGDMCGIAPGIETSPKKKPPLGSSRPRQIKSHVGEIEEEHTAIEVEFVEPDPAFADIVAEDDNAPADQRKNAYLSAMARKAKEEFQSRREDAPADERSAADMGTGSGMGGGASVASNASSMGPKLAVSSSAMSSASSAAGTGGGGSVSSDVYNRFTASDKRKFLKLINNGLSPAEASEQVLQDRKASSGSSGSAASSVPKSPSKGGRAFGFWKRSPNKNADNEQAEGASDAVLATRIGSYGSQEFGSPVADSSSTGGGASSGGAGKVAVVPVPDLNELRVIDETAPESESDTEAMPFARSGINYYDAVRRREQEDSDGDTEEFPATSATPGTSSKGKSRGLFSQKLLPRFTPLDDRRDTTPVRSRSAPREGGRRGVEEANMVQPTEALPRGEEFASSASATYRRAVSDTGHDAFEDPELAAGLLAIAEIKQAIRSEAKTEAKTDSKAKADDAGAPTETANKAATSTTGGSLANKSAGVQPMMPKPESQMKLPPKPRATVMTLAPLEPKSMQRKGEGDSVSKIEQNLLRPVPREESSSLAMEQQNGRAPVHFSSSLNGMKRKDDAGGVATNPATPVPKPSNAPMAAVPEIVRKDSLDVSMHTYMSSAEMYAPSNASVVSAGHDNMSVYTVGTGVSAMSQSSRVRRPGAAKDRIAKAKQMDGTPSRRGWHESMKAAAQSHNRVWDPRYGWVDYQAPDDHAGEVPLAQQPDKLRVDLQRAVKPKRPEIAEAGDSGDSEAAAQVPFPSDWEAERKQMIGDTLAPESMAQVEAKTQATERGVVIPDADSLMKSELLAETMRPTTSLRGRSELSWSPDRGRQVLETREKEARMSSPRTAVASDPVAKRDFNPEQRPDTKQAESVDVALAETSSRGVSPSPATPNSEQNPIAADSTEKPETVPAESRVVEEKYVQIGNNGSVRSISKERKKPPMITPRPAMPSKAMEALTLAENYISDDDDDDQVPLLNETGSFASIGMTESLMSPNVAVVKQKVDQEDVNYFQHNEAKSPPREGHLKPRSVTQSDPKVSVPSIQASASGSSSRRSGPIDLDEDMEASDFETDDEKAWGLPEGGEARNFELSTSSSGFAKPVPRLQGSKRDTSPVKVRKTADEVFPVYESPTTAPSSNAVPVTPDSSDPSPSPQDDSRPRQQDRSSNAPTRSPSGSHLLPSVRAKLHQWEVRAGKSEDGLSEVASDVSAEWKTLLGKKVSAEHATAAKQRQNSRPIDATSQDVPPHTESSTLATPVGGGQARARRGSPDDDSLFHFRDQADSRPSTSKLSAASLAEASQDSPIENIEEDSDKDVSEAYGPRPGERSSFFKRFMECTAPVMPLKHACGRASDSAPSEVFSTDPYPMSSRMKTVENDRHDGARIKEPNGSHHIRDAAERVAEQTQVPSQSKEEKSEKDAQTDAAQKYVVSQASRRNEQSRPRSAPRPQSQGRSESRRGPSSVVSEDFGAKTAYLEAIAAKTAVSKPRRSSSRHRSRSISGSSVASNASSQHSEKWKAFLERKRSGMASPPKSRASTDVSRAAEKYAAVKVEEMMLMMSTKHKAADYKQSRDPTLSRMMKTPGSIASEDSSEDWRLKRSDSVRAAEDLAAARVEAMMAALSGNHLDEAEI